MTLLAASGFHHWLARWAPAATWAVAIGTLALAFATWRLGTKANAEAGAVTKQARAVADQVEVGQKQLEASQRPLIVPIVAGWLPDLRAPGWEHLREGVRPPFSPWIMLSNSGKGPGYNVSGALYWPGGIGGGAIIEPTTIAASAAYDVPVTGANWSAYKIDWSAVRGYLRYTDLSTIEWQTHFAYSRDPLAGHWSVKVLAVGKTEALGEPEYSLEQGWLNPPT